MSIFTYSTIRRYSWPSSSLVNYSASGLNIEKATKASFSKLKVLKLFISVKGAPGDLIKMGNSDT